MYFFHILSIVFYDKNVLKIHKNEKCLLRITKKILYFEQTIIFTSDCFWRSILIGGRTVNVFAIVNRYPISFFCFLSVQVAMITVQGRTKLKSPTTIIIIVIHFETESTQLATKAIIIKT